MEDVKNQNPYAPLKSPPVAELATDANRISYANECFWFGVVSVVALITAVLLSQWEPSLSIGAFLTATFRMLLYLVGGAAGIFGFVIGLIEIIGQQASKKPTDQFEKALGGIVLCLVGPAIYIVYCFFIKIF